MFFVVARNAAKWDGEERKPSFCGSEFVYYRFAWKTREGERSSWGEDASAGLTIAGKYQE